MSSIYIYIYIYYISSLRVNDLTLILLTWRKWWTPNNASKWRMGFNPAFKVLNYWLYHFKLPFIVTRFFPHWTSLHFICAALTAVNRRTKGFSGATSCNLVESYKCFDCNSCLPSSAVESAISSEGLVVILQNYIARYSE